LSRRPWENRKRKQSPGFRREAKLANCISNMKNRSTLQPANPLPQQRCAAKTVADVVVRALLVMLVCIASAFPRESAAAEPVSRETLIKAAYLLKFPHYVQWPASSFERQDSPLVIGVLGDGPVVRVLESRAPKATARGRKIVVRRFKSMDDYKPCHVLFVPATVDARTQTQAIAKTQKQPVLLVGERAGFATAGGAMNFYLDANRTIGFEINRDATLKHALKIDARLLRLARVVTTRPPSSGGG